MERMEKKVHQIVVKDEDGGKRIDRFLAERFADDYSRAFIQKMVRGGSVCVNGDPARNSYRLEAGDAVEMTVSEEAKRTVAPEEIPLDIVHEDGQILVVNKPAGLVVHPAPGNYSGTLVNAALAHCGGLAQGAGSARAGIVHRLDKGTSGLIVIAKTDKAHRSLGKQFKNKTVKKIYVALVKGIVQYDNGIIDAPIGRCPLDRRKMSVDSAHVKDAYTTYTVLKRYKDFTALEIRLTTGRTHQIRVHMAHIGYPIAGDITYGGQSSAIERPALHAKSIGFTHPGTGTYVEFTTGLPEDMQAILRKGYLH